MIIKTNPVTYLHASANKDMYEFMKLPVVTPNNSRRIEDLINYSYLKDSKIKFKNIVGPHVVALCVSTDTSVEQTTAYVEFYRDAKCLAKICLLNLLERAKYAKGALLRNLIDTDSLFRNMKQDFSEEIIDKAISVFVQSVESLEGLECVNILQSINLLNREDFKIVVDLLTGELQKIYKLEYCSLMDVEELNNKLTKDELFYKYFVKQIRIDVPCQDTNHCCGSIVAIPSVVPYFNVKAIVDDSALIERNFTLNTNLVANIRELENYLPIATQNELEVALVTILIPTISSSFERKIYTKLLIGELMRALLQTDEYFDDADVFNNAVKMCIESL